MTFALPAILWLAVVPVVLLVLDVSIGSNGNTFPRIRRLWAGPGGFSDASVASEKRRWRLWLGLILVIFAAARPQWGRIEEQTFDQSREVLIALDLSRSMLAEDVKPSRLERAKLLIESLLDRLRGERVGLILFSGTAFLQSPLSPDYEVLREFLPALDSDYMPEGGTDFDRLLSVALDSFSNEGGADRFLIVLSDGESQTDAWRSRIEKMTQRTIRVIALGIGTEAGAVMPAKGGGFVKDARGAVVLSKLGTQTMRDLARLTSGSYANAAAWVDLAALLEQTVERGKQGGFVQRSELRLIERYQWFLAAGMLLLGWSYWREFPVRPRARDLKGRVTTMAAGAIAAFLVATGAPDAGAATGDLPELAKTLSAQRALSADDAERFASATIDYGKGRRESGAKIPPTVLHDGFASVDLGERLDRNAADWPELRRQLEELARPPEQQQKQDQKKDEQKKQEEQQDQKKEQQDEQSQEQKEQEQQSEEQKQDEKKSGQKAFDDPPPQQSEEPEKQQPQKNMQSVGGEPAQDQELLEKPELAVPLQKLDRVKQQDSPAKLFQLLQNDEPKPRDKKERDW